MTDSLHLLPDRPEAPPDAPPEGRMPEAVAPDCGVRAPFALEPRTAGLCVDCRSRDECALGVQQDSTWCCEEYS